MTFLPSPPSPSQKKSKMVSIIQPHGRKELLIASYANLFIEYAKNSSLKNVAFCFDRELIVEDIKSKDWTLTGDFTFPCNWEIDTEIRQSVYQHYRTLRDMMKKRKTGRCIILTEPLFVRERHIMDQYSMVEIAFKCTVMEIQEVTEMKFSKWTRELFKEIAEGEEIPSRVTISKKEEEEEEMDEFLIERREGNPWVLCNISTMKKTPPGWIARKLTIRGKTHNIASRFDDHLRLFYDSYTKRGILEKDDASEPPTALTSPQRPFRIVFRKGKELKCVLSQNTKGEVIFHDEAVKEMFKKEENVEVQEKKEDVVAVRGKKKKQKVVVEED